MHPVSSDDSRGKRETTYNCTHRWTPSYYKKLKKDEGQITEVFFYGYIWNRCDQFSLGHCVSLLFRQKEEGEIDYKRDRELREVVRGGRSVAVSVTPGNRRSMTL